MIIDGILYVNSNLIGSLDGFEDILEGLFKDNVEVHKHSARSKNKYKNKGDLKNMDKNNKNFTKSENLNEKDKENDFKNGKNLENFNFKDFFKNWNIFFDIPDMEDLHKEDGLNLNKEFFEEGKNLLKSVFDKDKETFTQSVSNISSIINKAFTNATKEENKFDKEVKKDFSEKDKEKKESFFNSDAFSGKGVKIPINEGGFSGVGEKDSSNEEDFFGLDAKDPFNEGEFFSSKGYSSEDLVSEKDPFNEEDSFDDLEFFNNEEGEIPFSDENMFGEMNLDDSLGSQFSGNGLGDMYIDDSLNNILGSSLSNGHMFGVNSLDDSDYTKAVSPDFWKILMDTMIDPKHRIRNGDFYYKFIMDKDEEEEKKHHKHHHKHPHGHHRHYHRHHHRHEEKKSKIPSLNPKLSTPRVVVIEDKDGYTIRIDY